MIIEAGAASVIAVTAHSPFGETERSAGRWLPYLRLLAAIALAGLAILALQLGAVGQNLNDVIAVLARNVIGFTGLGAAVLAGHRRPARLDAPDRIHDVLPVRPARRLDRPVDLAGPPARRPRRLDLRLRGLHGRPAPVHHPRPPHPPQRPQLGESASAGAPSRQMKSFPHWRYMMRDLLKPVLVTAVIVLPTPGITGAGAPRTATAATRASTAPRAAAAATVAPVVACGQLASDGFSNVPDAPTVVLSATQASGFCQVVGYIAPQEQFLLTLPVSGYTDRYLEQGCGGLCGIDIPPAGSGGTASSTDSASKAPATTCAAVSAHAAAAGGMAMGFDNQGHIGGATDGVWAKDDPALRVSFGYASEHALAQAAKAIITAYYGKPPAYSYYNGCSDGGHEALVEAQRYPHDFNGILGGAPGNIEAQLLGVVPAWLVAVNTGTHGREVLTSEKLPALHAAVIRACGNAQGLIEDPRSCDFNPATIQCPAGADNSSCLTPAQVTVVREFYLGPNDGHGHYLYPGGEPYGSELAWAGAAVDPAE